ncbi:hypothetical protein [Mesorhizobium sp.]|uniref:hypothetical protein n=1 Tax=Mesorhizobium sp. TaxID=1871066 RepID=UPI000FE3F048|nr:hypothetical protein [Mesorhizobium sp.]RWN99389.1 MAG: hypothetical protein EOS06_18540 [Mesorhizobium sp.]
MDKNDGDNLPEGFPGNLPEDPVILADITKRISREIDGKIGPDRLAVTEARRDRNLVEEWEEADPAIDSQPPVVPLFLVLLRSLCWAWQGTPSLVGIFHSAL